MNTARVKIKRGYLGSVVKGVPWDDARRGFKGVRAVRREFFVFIC